VSERRVIGVDLGGTKILSGIVTADGEVERRHEIPTPLESQDALLAGLDEAVEALLDERIEALGFGLPSRVDQRTGRAEGSVNIPLVGLDFRDRMEQRFDLPVGIDNDANAAALAEWAFGAGRGSEDMVMLTLGSGVGGGVVVGGRPYRGWAEIGHIVIEHDGPPCQGTCTGRGHLEAFCSGHAAGEAARRVFGPGADSHRLIRLADEGEEQALAILREHGRRLGSGIGTLINIFRPEVVVIGGGFSAAFDYLLPHTREVVRREALPPANEDVRIVRAELGTAAGLVGAALIGFESLAAA
jgi:glucokinase